MIPLTKYDFQGSVEQWGRDEIYPGYIYYHPWRIHGAGIYANMTGVYWWDPCYHKSSTMDPSWVPRRQSQHTSSDFDPWPGAWWKSLKFAFSWSPRGFREARGAPIDDR